jgi:hypothetical protein
VTAPRVGATVGDSGVDETVPERTESDRTRIDPPLPGATSAGGTVVDRPSPATRIDGTPAAGPGAATTGYARVNLPPLLAGRFEVIRELPGGAEADVLLCTDRSNGEHRVIKLYRTRGVSLDDDMLTRVQHEAGTPHVVRSYEWGEEHSTWYEVQEYVTGGSLGDLIDDEGPLIPLERTREIFDELVIALIHIHDLEIVHRDLKPQNVLVRQRHPLDLVLSDFGLATVVDRSRTMRSGSRTPAYGGPEAAWGDVSRGRDWWSVGIMLIELITGEHPFRRPDGSWMEDAEIGSHLSTRPIDTSAVTDPRWNRLIRGLLVRDPQDRWGAAEVLRWQAGEDAPVPEDAAVAGTSTASIAPYAFDGKVIHTPRELAGAMSDRWGAARRLLAGAKANDTATASLQSWLNDHGADRASRIITEGGSPERRLVRLLVAMDPGLPPSFAGEPMDRAGASALARRAAAADPEAMKALASVYEADALGAFAACPGHEDLAEVNAAWRRAMGDVEEGVKELPSAVRTATGDLIGSARGATLLACTDERNRTTVHDRATEASTSTARSVAWFADHLGRATAERDRLAADIITIAIAPVAQAEAEEDRLAAAEERRKADEQRHEERRAALAFQTGPARQWLLWPGLFNTLIGTAALAVTIKGQEAIDKWELQHEAQIAEPVQRAHDLAPLLSLCLVVGIACFAFRRVLRSAERPAVLRQAQVVSVIGTCTFPLLIPFGIVHAYSTARSIAQHEGIEGGSRRVRLWGLIGGTLALFAGIGAVVQQQTNRFDAVASTWPGAVASWYYEHWPSGLRPEQIAHHAPLIAVVGGLIAIAGIGGGWASYRNASRTLRRTQIGAAVAGILLGLILLPVILTALGFALVAVAYIVGVILALIVGGFILAAICDEM